MTEIESIINIFLLDEDLEDFRKIEDLDDVINEKLNSRLVYLLCDPKNKIFWIWNGAKANVRMKFIASQKAPIIRDEYGIDFKIIRIDEDSEPSKFKDFLGLG